MLLKLYWEDWTSGYSMALAEVISHTLICLLMLLVLVVYIHSFCCQKTTSSRVEKLFRMWLLISILLGSIVVIGSYIMSNIIIVIFNIRYDNHCFYRVLISGIPMASQRCILYTFLVYRLKIAFVGSIYEINSKSIMALLWFLVFLAVTVSSIQSYFSSIHRNFGCYNSTPLFITNVIGGILDLIASIFLMFLFIYKLKQLIKLDTKHIGMRQVINKLTILAVVSIGSSLILGFAIGLNMFTYQGLSIGMNA